MAEPRLLEGTIVPDVDPEVGKLRKQVRDLERDLDDARREARRAREDADRALSALRKQLVPLYRALQMVFGELDAAGVTEVSSDPPPHPGAQPSAGGAASGAVRGVWQSWIEKFGVASIQGRIVTAMLDHGPMTTEQLRVAAKIGTSSAFEGIKRLKKLGLVDKNASGKYALKEL